MLDSLTRPRREAVHASNSGDGGEKQRLVLGVAKGKNWSIEYLLVFLRVAKCGSRRGCRDPVTFVLTSVVQMGDFHGLDEYSATPLTFSNYPLGVQKT